MEIHIIPIEDKFIIYRPLIQTAFVGNQAMADLTLKLANDGKPDAPDEIRAFLQAVGFLRPDPPQPSMPDRAFRPTTAVLLVTNRCNLRCIYCYANAGAASPVDMTFDQAKIAIDYAHENAKATGAQQFEVSFHGGGEPLQSWSLIKQTTEYARSKDIPCQVTMVSNGVWSETQRQWVLQNMNGVTISTDGGPETQNHNRPLSSGAETHTQVLKTTKALDEAKFDYGIRMTAIAPWRETFPADVRYLVENTQCQTLQVEPAFNTIRGQHQSAAQAESDAFVDAFMEAWEIAVQAGRNLSYSGARLGLITTSFCTAPYSALILNADGKLVTCYEVASDNHSLVEVSTIGHVVDSQIHINDSARHRLFDYMENKQATTCQTCFCRWQCAGDCYARSTLVEDGGRLIASHARCYTNRELTRRLLLRLIMQGDGVWQGMIRRQAPISL